MSNDQDVIQPGAIHTELAAEIRRAFIPRLFVLRKKREGKDILAITRDIARGSSGARPSL